jgi:tetratricopeptide (TPR) repeat protein
MKLTLKEITLIKLHMAAAAMYRLSDHTWHRMAGLLMLFSNKTRAVRLMKSGEIFEVQGETATAIDYFERALEKCPKLFELHLNLCRCYLRGLDLRKAKDHGTRFMKKKPDSPEGLLYMGVILYYENRIEAALDDLKRAAELLPAREKKAASAHEYMGECNIKLGQYEDAVACFEKSIKLNPLAGGEKKYVSLGEAYYALNKKEESLDAFKKALAVNPQNHEAWNNIGVLMWSVGNLENAEKCFRKSLSIKPDYKEAVNNIAEVDEALKSRRRSGRNKIKF